LQLAAVSLQKQADAAGFIQSFTGSNRLVLDYLIEEVLSQQTEEIQDFLLQTAVLDRLAGSLCDAVRFDLDTSGREESQSILEDLERANLFLLPLDDERRWYRYHHLFADLLRQRLHQAQPDLEPILHRRASDWFEKNGMLDWAIEHALRGEDFKRAVALLDRNADAIWKRGELANLMRWLNRLPRPMLSAKPLLTIFPAWHFYASGDRERAERILQTIEQALEPGAGGQREALRLAAEDRMKLQGRIAAVRALMLSWWGDVQQIIRYANAVTWLWWWTSMARWWVW
jgi:LuxR family maltose regulon positive regulatory protein